MTADLASGLQAAPRHIGSGLEFPSLQQEIALDHIHPDGALPVRGLSQRPAAVQDGESLRDLPVRGRLNRQVRQDAGHQAGGADCFGDLQGAAQALRLSSSRPSAWNRKMLP